MLHPRPDFRSIVRRRLPPLRGEGAREADVVEELAQILDDAWDDRSPHRPEDDEAVLERWMRRQIPHWPDLAAALEATPPPPPEPWASSASTRRRFMTGWTHDFRGALRMLRKNPGFTAVAILTLAIGIGLNSAVFSLVESILLRPAPVADADRLVRLYSSVPDGFFAHEAMAYPDLVDVDEEVAALDSVAGYAMAQLALTAGGVTEVVLGEMATGSYFVTLGLRPRLGRLFGPHDDRRGGAAAVTVLSHSAWQRRFAGADDVVGRELSLNGRAVTVIGVMPASFRGSFPAVVPELWIPSHLAIDLGATPMQGSGSTRPGVHLAENRDRRWLWTIARLADGISFDVAEAAVASLGQALAAEYPDTNEERDLVVMPFTDVTFLPGGVDQGIRFASFVLLGLVALVLLISSANLAGMLLARAARRRQEIATRLSLGASRRRLIRQLLIESLALALLGGAAGLVIAGVAAEILAGWRLPSVLPVEVATELNSRVVLFTLGLSTLAAMVFGLTPAFEATRTDLASILREEGGSTTASRRRRRLQSALVVGQVAFSTVLLVFAALSVRSARNAGQVDIGLDREGLAVAQLDPELQGRDEDRTAPFFAALRQELDALPSVESVAYASHLPLTFYINSWDAVPDGQEGLPEREWPDVDVARVDASYFRTLRIPLLAGRSFERIQVEEGHQVAVVNEALANRFWPGSEAVGRRLRFSRDGDPYEVVGVVPTAKYRTLGEAPRPFLYLPLSPATSSRFVVVRSRGGDDRLGAGTLGRALRDLDPLLAVSSHSTFEDAMSPSLVLPRLSAAFFGIFGVLGLAIAAIGLYGVIAYAVAQRTHEIGIRVAIGADHSDVVRLVLRQGLSLTIAGLVLGLAAALAFTRALSAILYGVAPNDLPTFGVVATALLAVTALACWLPARRALRIDPLAALRFS